MTPSQLRAAIELLEISQAELGRRLGLSKTEIYRKTLDVGRVHHRPISEAQAVAVWGLLSARCAVKLYQKPREIKEPEGIV